jgi:ankyrin repeat protein
MSVVSFGPKRQFVEPEGGQAYECAICLETLKTEDGSIAPSLIDGAERVAGITVLPCGHENHTACLKRNEQIRGPNCPECRAAYQPLFNHVQPAVANPVANAVAPPAPPVNVNQLFRLAVRHGNTHDVARLIAAGADVNGANPSGETVLMIASLNADMDSVVLLIEAGADVNAVNNRGEPALMIASMYGRERVVIQLLAAGANVNAASHDGGTALISASSSPSEGTVARLIDAGANVNAVNNDGLTALMGASMYGREGVVARLIDAGANVNAATQHGTSIMIARLNHREAVVALLVAAGAQ